MKGIGAGELHHIAVAVPSLADAIPFYRDLLGYRVDEPRVIADQHVRVAFATHDGTRVELLEPTDAESGVARFVAERGRPTLHHLCFVVDGLAATLDRLANEGVELVDRAPRRGVEGMVAFLHPRAANGVLVELIDRASLGRGPNTMVAG
ncbi:MAG TPA: methylmalonyl-CoA epimerase [Candidatus Limnocylindria bacterium]|nr:methylmalonyl-CoA epimerase [Candidatus Limnocylindria bacterium]